MRKQVKRIIRNIVFWILGIVLTLCLCGLLGYFLIQQARVQRFIADKVALSLSGQLKTTVQVGEVHFSLFDQVKLRDFYVQDQVGDSLIYADQIDVNIAFFSLMKRKVIIEKIYVQGLEINTSQLIADSTYNYSFILEAFGNGAEGNNNIRQPPSWSVSMKELDLDNYKYVHSDLSGQHIELRGELMKVTIDSLDSANSWVDIGLWQTDHLHIDWKTPATDSNIKAQPSQDNILFNFLPQTGWHINIHRHLSKNASVNVRPNGPEPVLEGFDFQNFSIAELNLDTKDIRVNDDVIEMQVSGFSFVERGGFTLNQLSAALSVLKHEIGIAALTINTPGSSLVGKSKMSIPKDAYVRTWKDSIHWSAELAPSQISLREMELFALDLATYINTDLGENIALQGDASGTWTRANLSNLQARIGKYLDVGGDVHLAKKGVNGEWKVALNLKKLKTSYAALQVITRNLAIPENLAYLGEISLRGRFDGDVKHLYIKKLAMSTSSSVNFELSGKIDQLNDLDKLNFDLNFDHLNVPAKGLVGLVNDSTQMLLDRFGDLAYHGQIFGQINALTTKGTITSGIGKINSDLTFHFLNNYTSGSYQGTLDFIDINLGAALARPEMGDISSALEIDGTGWSVDDVKTAINAHISEITYRQKTYRDIGLSGSLNGPLIRGQVTIDNEDLRGSVDGNLDLSADSMHIDITGNIDHVDLYALKLVEKPLAASLKTNVSLSGPDMYHLDGRLAMPLLRLADDSIEYSVNDFELIARTTGSQRDLSITSSFVDVNVTGNFNEFRILDVLKKQLAWPVASIPEPSDSVQVVVSDNLTSSKDSFSIHVNLKDNALLSLLGLEQIPQAKEAVVDLHVDASVNSFSLNGNFKDLIYQDLTSETVRISAGNASGSIEGRIDLSDVVYKSVEVPMVCIDAGLMSKGTLFSLAMARDSTYRFMDVSGILSEEDGKNMMVLNEEIILNNDAWSIVPNHEIYWNEDGIHIEACRIVLGDKSVSFNGHSLVADSKRDNDINLGFIDFPIDYLTHVLEQDIGQFNGVINGNVHLSGDLSLPTANAKLAISNLEFENGLLGDLILRVENLSGSDIVTIEASLTNDETSLVTNGILKMSEKTIEVETQIDRLSLKSLEPFFTGFIEESEGYVKGQLRLSGNYMHPVIEGNLSLHDIQTNLAYTGMQYTIDNQSIILSDRLIEFGEMVVTDGEKRQAFLSGKINHEDFSNFVLDLSFSTDDFGFLNTTAAVNELFYGKLILKTSGTVKGPIAAPVVQMSALTLPGTILYISAFPDVDLASYEGVVIFSSPEAYLAGKDEIQSPKVTFPLTLELNLELTDNAELQFIVDPISGDKLITKGESNLTIKLRPPGVMEMFGSYVVSSGRYDFSYSEFLKKNFDIQRGSIVTFNGDPLSATFDATAIYSTETSTYELIKNESTLTSSEILQARRKSQVDVSMKLTGQLQSPEISFDLSLPGFPAGSLEDMISAKLQNLKSQPSDMNNQVFGLLLFNSFIVPGGSSEGGGNSIVRAGTGQALSSVSSLFTQQLNNLADKYVKGVEVNFDLNSYQTDRRGDQSSSIVTSVGVGVSKQLLGDRLRIEATGNLDFEDSSTQSEKYTAIAGNFLLEYKLNETGQYLLRVYRRDYSDTLTGEKTAKNGIGIMFKKSFDDRNE